MSSAEAMQRIARLRELRARERDFSARKALDAQLRTIEVARAAGGRVGEAFARGAPEEVRREARVRDVRRGVVTIEAASAAARFVVDAWVRGGGLRVLQQGSAGEIRRVRIEVRG